MSNTYVFTLVHGTRSPRIPWIGRDQSCPSWITDESSFCRRLRDAFAPDTAICVPFTWTGRNRASDRGQAAAELAEKVAANAQQYPFARQVVIGHSHGGTIACLALNDRHYAENLSGIVCMSTPFIHIRKRPVDLTHELSLVVPSCFLMLSLLFSAMAMPSYWLHVAAVSAVAASGIWGVLLLYFSGPDRNLLRSDAAVSRLPSQQYPYLKIEENLSDLQNAINEDTQESESRWRYAKALEDALIRRIVVPPCDRVPTLIVRVAGDEASGALTVARFVAWISAFGTPFARILPNPLGKLIFLAAVAIAAWQLLHVWYTASSWLVATVGSVMLLAIAATIAFFVTGILTLVLAGLLTLPVFIGFLLLPVAYGTDLTRLFARFEVSVEETPPGRHVVEQLSFIPNEGLLHSAAYDHDGVPEVVRRWLTVGEL